jgi:DNA-binding LacI/PurR family transcriptional regulator
VTFTNQFFSDLVRGVEQVAAKVGCSVLLSDSAHDLRENALRSTCINS